MELLLLAIVLQLAAGVAALACARWPRAATLLGSGGAVAGCLLAMAPTLRVLLGGPADSLNWNWDATHGAFRLEVDSLSAFFLLPVLGLSVLAAVYGGDYLLGVRHIKSLGSPWFFFNAFVAGMVMVLVARTVLIFLVAWEVMSIAAFCLVTFESEKADVRQAGWIFLIAAHLGVIFLFIVFLLLGRHAGSLEFDAFRSMPILSAGWAGLILVLAVVGFGAKAGLVPFHVWLPEAHPAAPSHVSALMSGVMIKMGWYGIWRVVTFLGQPAPWFGLLLAGLGVLTALVGMALAVHQRDLKRLLAYSSIENMGLIALVLGVGLWGWASNMPGVAVVGTAAAMLHIWNHALIKGLMFFAAGSVVHATGTKDMEQLGGLMRRMPWTGRAMTLGALAIAALPPLNGFVSKWLVYLSLLECGLPTGQSGSLIALLAVGVLALIGGLAVLVFVRLIGVVLLGAPRTSAAEHAHESSAWMLGPMLVLIFLCLTVAVIPETVTGLFTSTLRQILGPEVDVVLLDSTAAPLSAIGNANAWILIVMVLGAAMLRALTRSALQSDGPTWGCGYAKPSARMQFSGRSFAELLAEHLLPRFLRPRMRRQPPEGLFPAAGRFAAESPDPFLESVCRPFFRRWANRFARLRFLQQGKVHVYLVYIMVVVVLALSWASLRTWLWGRS